MQISAKGKADLTVTDGNVDVAGNAHVSGTLFAGCAVKRGPDSAQGTGLVSPVATCPTDKVALSGGAACYGSDHRLVSTVLDGASAFKADIYRATSTYCWAWAMCCRFGN